MRLDVTQNHLARNLASAHVDFLSLPESFGKDVTPQRPHALEWRLDLRTLLAEAKPKPTRDLVECLEPGHHGANFLVATRIAEAES